MELTAIVHDEDGKLWAEIEELPGCFASSATEGELHEGVEEAVSMCLPRPQRLLLWLQGEKPRIVYRELVA